MHALLLPSSSPHHTKQGCLAHTPATHTQRRPGSSVSPGNIGVVLQSVQQKQATTQTRHKESHTRSPSTESHRTSMAIDSPAKHHNRQGLGLCVILQKYAQKREEVNQNHTWGDPNSTHTVYGIVPNMVCALIRCFFSDVYARVFVWGGWVVVVAQGPPETGFFSLVALYHSGPLGFRNKCFVCLSLFFFIYCHSLALPSTLHYLRSKKLKHPLVGPRQP